MSFLRSLLGSLRSRLHGPDSCSFCGRGRERVGALTVSGSGLAMCGACARLGRAIMVDPWAGAHYCQPVSRHHGR